MVDVKIYFNLIDVNLLKSYHMSRLLGIKMCVIN